MMNSVHSLITLLVIFFLFIACGSTDSGIGNTIISTSIVRPLVRLKQQLSPVGVNGCPSRLNTCHTPHSLRVAYGIDPLIQKGFTGKGQTIIDIVSFGSPTLQQDMEVFDQTFNLPPVNLQVISPLNIPEVDAEDKAGGHRRPSGCASYPCYRTRCKNYYSAKSSRQKHKALLVFQSSVNCIQYIIDHQPWQYCLSELGGIRIDTARCTRTAGITEMERPSQARDN